MTRQYWRQYLWAVGLIALFFTGKLIYVLFYTLLLVYSAARWVTRKGFESLIVQRQVSADRFFRGEELSITLEARNPGWAPLVWVSLTDELPVGLPALSPRRAVFALAPGQHVSFSYRTQGRNRGVYQIGPMHVETGDAWGLEVLRGRIDTFQEVVVYPKVTPLANIGLPSSLPVGEVRTAQRFFEDPARTSGVREYRPGDPLKRMHWRVSARVGTLHVREFSPTIALESALFLNLNDEEYDVHSLGHMSEFAIEVAASLAYYLHQRRQPVGLITNGRDGGPVVGQSDKTPIRIASRKGASQLMQVMEALARVQVQQGKPFRACLMEEARQLSWGSTVLVVTPEDTEETVEALFSLRRAGYLVMVFLVGNRVIHPEFLTSSPLPGITFYRCRHSGELEALGQQRIAG